MSERCNVQEFGKEQCRATKNLTRVLIRYQTPRPTNLSDQQFVVNVCPKHWKLSGPDRARG